MDEAEQPGMEVNLQNEITSPQHGFGTMQESSGAKLCLKVSGYPPPDIKWYVNGVLLEKDERHAIYANNGLFGLTIDPVKVEDAGAYTCMATNKYGQTSTSALFQVQKLEKEDAAPFFVKSLADQIDCKENDVIRFDCEVDGWPEPKLVWLVNDEPLLPSDNFLTQYDGKNAKLEIRNAQPNYSGKYTVRISNEHGDKMSSSMLTVAADPDKIHVAPVFEDMIENVECYERDTVKFKAVLKGDPVPLVTWHIDGVALIESKKIHCTNEDGGIYLLTIKDVSRQLGGIVMCQGTNQAGYASCEARLIVRVPQIPQFERAMKDRVLTEGGAVMFELDVVHPEKVQLEEHRKLIADYRVLEGKFVKMEALVAVLGIGLTTQNQWDESGSNVGIEISERLIARHRGEYVECCSVFAIGHIPKQSAGIFYFEVKMLEKKGRIHIGLAPITMRVDSEVGNEGSFGYQCNGTFSGHDEIEGCSRKGPKFEKLDVIGCGLNLATRKIMYTKNGKRLETSDSLIVPAGELFPCVTLFEPGDKIEANFGPNFEYAIDWTM
uniref:Ig-like domain-containing protein n=1 Tax=Globodera pallida TaxID=36090 RepID=A0A183BN52_GLOPA